MAKISGTVTQNKSYYSFWLETSVADYPSSRIQRVTVKAYLKQANRRFNAGTSSTITITIDGTKTSKTWSGGYDSTAYATTATILLFSATKDFAYSTSTKSVAVSSVTSGNWEAGAHGPGKMSASGSAGTLAAKYSTAGTLTGTSTAEDALTMTMSGLPAVSYTRYVHWYHKLSTASSYTSDGSTTTQAAGAVSKAVSGLIPGQIYNLLGYISSPAGNYATKTANVTMPAAAGEFSVFEIGTINIKSEITGIKDTTAYARQIRYSIKRTTDTSWTVAATQTIAANVSAESPWYEFAGLLPGTSYDLKAELIAGGITYKAMTVEQQITRYAELPTVRITRVFNTPPSNSVAVTFSIDNPKEVTDCTHTVYLLRNGVETEVATTTDPVGSIVTLSFIADWLNGTETVQFKVVTSNPYASGTATSNVFTASLTTLFLWDTAKTKYKPFLLTASEWNRLGDYIEAKTGSSIQGATQGNSVTASHVSGAFTALEQTVDVGATITAQLLNQLSDAASAY